ncbi:hypothetical protein HDU76_007686 [Blyttiomyces sp. JEL0837]|nr:hypothetical protein HDU76_007686 [Blyttiomyces sp. JEL0837]
MIGGVRVKWTFMFANIINIYILVTSTCVPFKFRTLLDKSVQHNTSIGMPSSLSPDSAPLLPTLIYTSAKSNPTKDAIIFYNNNNKSASLSGSQQQSNSDRLEHYSYKYVWNTAVAISKVIQKRLSGVTSTVSSKEVDESVGNKAITTVGIFVPDGPMLPILQLAVILTRPAAALVPLDSRDPRLHLVLDDAEPSLVIVTNADEATIFKNASKRCPASSASKLEKSVILLLNDLQNEAHSMCKEETGLLEINLHAYSGDDISHIFFTSGSTGRPKGCIANLTSLTSYCTAKLDSHEITSTSTVFVASAHTFDPSLGDFMSTLSIGATIAITSRETLLSSLSTCLHVTKSTHVCTTPALFETVIDKTEVECGFAKLEWLQVVALGGESMSWRLRELVPDRVRLFNTYGVTECCVYQSMCEIERGFKLMVERKGLGKPMGDCRILVMAPKNSAAGGNHEDEENNISNVDMMDMEPLLNFYNVDGDGNKGDIDLTKVKLGEIWISGTQVGLGYLKREELTKERFILHPVYGRCYRTGDLACILKIDGIEKVIFQGRRDTQLKIRGQRIELEEIEQVLLKKLAPLIVKNLIVVFHAEMKCLVCFCLFSERVVNDVGGVVELEDSRINLERVMILLELVRVVAERSLPVHMIPSRFIPVVEFPQTATGKIARSVLARGVLPLVPVDWNGEDQDGFGGWVNVIRESWRLVLGVVDEVRIWEGTRFTEIGGDSLKAVRVCNRLADLWKEKQQGGGKLDGGGDNDEDGGEFGEQMGTFGPAEMVKRPLLRDYAAFLRNSVGNFDNDCDVVGRLVEAGKENQDPEVNPSSSTDPDAMLYRCAGLGMSSLVELLVSELQANVNGKGKATRRLVPIHAACLNSHLDTVATLIKLGASINIQDPTGATCLHLASQNGPVELVNLILDPTSSTISSPNPIPTSKPKPSSKKQSQQQTKNQDLLFSLDENLQTPLHHASRSGAPLSVINRLITLSQQTVLNQKDKWGRTPLHWASVNGHRDAVKALVEMGSDTKLVDENGEDAVEIAERRARCGANERENGVRSSVFGDIAKILGGSGGTKKVSKYK